MSRHNPLSNANEEVRQAATILPPIVTEFQFPHYRGEDILSPTSTPYSPLHPKHRLPFQSRLRSFDDLHAQCSYLLDSLQAENRKATELLRSITALEESLRQMNDSFSARRPTRKKLGWFKSRLEETSRQEKRILARLGQLTYEIQATERWVQIENERRQYELLQQHPYLNFSPALTQRAPQRQLDPTSPVFHLPDLSTPLTPHYWLPWGQQTGWQPSPFETPSHFAPQYRSGPAEVHSGQISLADTSANAAPFEDLTNPSRPSLTHRPSSMNDTSEQLDTLATNTGYALAPVVKRNSLPSLPSDRPGGSIWALTSEENRLGIAGLE